jgi:hypothetical protein
LKTGEASAGIHSSLYYSFNSSLGSEFSKMKKVERKYKKCLIILKSSIVWKWPAMASIEFSCHSHLFKYMQSIHT